MSHQKDNGRHYTKCENTSHGRKGWEGPNRRQQRDAERDRDRHNKDHDKHGAVRLEKRKASQRDLEEAYEAGKNSRRPKKDNYEDMFDNEKAEYRRGYRDGS